MREAGRAFAVHRLGLVPYSDALALQKRLVQARNKDEIPNTLLLLSHPHVITLGRSASARFLKRSAEELAALGYPVVEAGRGGEITYHGPDQTVLYPIIKLEEGRRDLHLFLRNLEEVGIAICRELGLVGERVTGRTGVWVAGQKVAAIGVRARAWVTFHGMAVNRGPDLTGFHHIVPCGLQDAGVTSLAGLLKRDLPAWEFEELAMKKFSEVFGSSLTPSDLPSFLL